MKKTIQLNNNFEICYPILEASEDAFINKALELSKEKCILELRLDYLLHGGMTINDIIFMIGRLRKMINNVKMIATIRTKKEGGQIDIEDGQYYNCISKLYTESNVEYIDVEYNYYIKKQKDYDEMFIRRKKKVIISVHEFDRTFSINEYKLLFDKLSDTSGDIVKVAINTPTKEELFDFMMAAKESKGMLVDKNKENIFIAMGKVGAVSRVWPEFTNTKLVFLTAYKEIDEKLGQMNCEKYVKFRKLLAKCLKN